MEGETNNSIIFLFFNLFDHKDITQAKLLMKDRKEEVLHHLHFLLLIFWTNITIFCRDCVYKFGRFNYKFNCVFFFNRYVLISLQNFLSHCLFVVISSSHISLFSTCNVNWILCKSIHTCDSCTALYLLFFCNVVSIWHPPITKDENLLKVGSQIY